MKTSVYHIYLMVSDKGKSFPFYKDLLGYLEYRISYEDDQAIGFTNGTCDIWLEESKEPYKKEFHRKNPGINHIAFKAERKEDVDSFYKEFLSPRNIKTLYDTPKEYPEYNEGYYAVYFEDPDRIKLEVCFIP